MKIFLQKKKGPFHLKAIFFQTFKKKTQFLLKHF